MAVLIRVAWRPAACGFAEVLRNQVAELRLQDVVRFYRVLLMSYLFDADVLKQGYI